jgi:hypothetical protein
MQYREGFSRVPDVIWAAGTAVLLLVLLVITDGKPLKRSNDCIRYVRYFEGQRLGERPEAVLEPVPKSGDYCVEWVTTHSYEKELLVIGIGEVAWTGLVVGVYWAARWIAAGFRKE